MSLWKERGGRGVRSAPSFRKLCGPTGATLLSKITALSILQRRLATHSGSLDGKEGGRGWTDDEQDQSEVWLNHLLAKGGKDKVLEL